MPMTVLVTNNAPDRFRGFLASCMLEVAPGIYTSPKMTTAVRKRIWDVLCDWSVEYEQAGFLLTWPDQNEPGGQGLRIIGAPGADLHEHDGLYLLRRALPEQFRQVLVEDGCIFEK